MTKQTNSDHALPTYKKALVQVVAYKRIRSMVNNVLSHFELNTTQWMILGMLYESATGLRSTDIARMLEVEAPLITRLSQSLVSAGLVENTSDTADKRAKPLALTRLGQSMVSKIEKELATKTHQLEQGLSNHEINNYFRTLGAFMDNSSGKS